MTLRVPANVGVVDQGETVYVAPLPDGPIIVLEGTAAVVWRAAPRGGRDTLARRVASRMDAAPAAIADDIAAFVDQLVAHGLLEDAAD